MKPSEKEGIKLAAIAGGLLLLYWLYRRYHTGAASVTPGADGTNSVGGTGGDPADPITSTYAQQPGAYNPPSLGDVNINIANQGLGSLSNMYIPLFGFVGMANNVYYQ